MKRLKEKNKFMLQVYLFILCIYNAVPVANEIKGNRILFRVTLKTL
jgi:hypothetical protein